MMHPATLFGIILGLVATVECSYPTETYARRAISSSIPSRVLKQDKWECATYNMTPIFSGPRPTGALSTAIQSYGDKLLKPCLATKTGAARISCTVSNMSSWCGFSVGAPSSIVSSYKVYGSSVVSWWRAKSSSAVSLSRDCPQNWNRFNLIDQYWYNFTVAQAKCFIAVTSKAKVAQESVASVTARAAAEPRPAIFGREAIATILKKFKGPEYEL